MQIGQALNTARKGQKVAVRLPNGQVKKFIAQTDIISTTVLVLGDQVISQNLGQKQLTRTTQFFQSQTNYVQESAEKEIVSLWQNLNDGSERIPFVRPCWNKQGSYFTEYGSGWTPYERIQDVPGNTFETIFIPVSPQIGCNVLVGRGGINSVGFQDYQNAISLIQDGRYSINLGSALSVNNSGIPLSNEQNYAKYYYVNFGSAGDTLGAYNYKYEYWRYNQVFNRYEFLFKRGVVSDSSDSLIPEYGWTGSGSSKSKKMTRSEAINSSEMIRADPPPIPLFNEYDEEGNVYYLSKIIISINITFSVRNYHVVKSGGTNVGWYVNFHNRSTKPILVLKTHNNESIRVYLTALKNKAYFVAQIGKIYKANSSFHEREWARILVVELKIQGNNIIKSERVYNNPEPILIDEDNYQKWAYSYLDASYLEIGSLSPLFLTYDACDRRACNTRRRNALQREFVGTSINRNTEYFFSSEYYIYPDEYTNPYWETGHNYQYTHYDTYLEQN